MNYASVLKASFLGGLAVFSFSNSAIAQCPGCSTGSIMYQQVSPARAGVSSFNSPLASQVGTTSSGLYRGPDGRLYGSIRDYQISQQLATGMNRNQAFGLQPTGISTSNIGGGRWVGNGIWQGPDGKYYDQPSTYQSLVRPQGNFAGPVSRGSSMGARGGKWINGLWQGPDGKFYDKPSTYDFVQHNRSGVAPTPNRARQQVPSPRAQNLPKPGPFTKEGLGTNSAVEPNPFRERDRRNAQKNGLAGVPKRFDLHIGTGEEKIEANGKTSLFGVGGGAALLMKVAVNKIDDEKRPLCEYGMGSVAHNSPIDENGYPNPKFITVTDPENPERRISAVSHKSLSVSLKPGFKTSSTFGIETQQDRSKRLARMTKEQRERAEQEESVLRSKSDAMMFYFTAPCEWYDDSQVATLSPNPLAAQKLYAIGQSSIRIPAVPNGKISLGQTKASYTNPADAHAVPGASGGPVTNENNEVVGFISSVNGVGKDAEYFSFDQDATKWMISDMRRHLATRHELSMNDFNGGVKVPSSISRASKFVGTKPSGLENKDS